ncbi:hypothetical protein SAMN06265370_1343 [Puniceibacterium sediminis]|uniref:Uncharacterized protein n=1 Tax=Puniceibacterium sediminis TaxID=1608407 RepID=A0A238ZLC8_9RHOB|nr:hypothetical protein SAMN06265370_1343 [Puniceibacterium sediminis]
MGLAFACPTRARTHQARGNLPGHRMPMSCMVLVNNTEVEAQCAAHLVGNGQSLGT